MEAFLATHPEFSLAETGSFLPTQPRVGSMVQLYPQVDGTDGSFIARMERKQQ